MIDMLFRKSLIVAILIYLCGLTMATAAQAQERQQTLVKHLSSAIDINAAWDKEPWRSIESIELTYHMGDYPEHFPNVHVKLAYDEQAIYIIYRVKDQFVLAETSEYQGSVYKDSCVEFFFTPGEDVSAGYFNLEMNCGGTALFHFQKQPWTNVVPVSRADFDQIEVAHSMPKIVSPEIQDTLTWTLEYRIPFSFLHKYTNAMIPAPGVKWRANFYKCADNSSHPHWLTWSPVQYNRPNFHLPEYFGELEFSRLSSVKDASQIPESFGLSNYLNPFNQSTKLQFKLRTLAQVELAIYNLQGQKIITLIHENCHAGVHFVNWNASDIASGIYLCRLQVGERVLWRKLTLVG